MSIRKQQLEEIVPLSAALMEQRRRDFQAGIKALYDQREAVLPYQLELASKDLRPTLMALRSREPITDLEAMSQGLMAGSYPSRPLSAAPNQLNLLGSIQRQGMEARINPADIQRTIRTEKEIDRRLAAEAIIRELGLEARAEPIIAELIQGPKATSTGQRLAAMQPAMNNIRPAQILALLAATGLGGGVTAALLDQGNQQQQQQPAMAAQ